MMQHTIHVWQKDDESKANTIVVRGAEQFDNVSFESKVKQFLSVLMPCHITRVKTSSAVHEFSSKVQRNVTHQNCTFLLSGTGGNYPSL